MIKSGDNGNGEGKRATQAEKDERIAKTMEMVIKGRSTADIKKWFRDELDISWGHALRYLRLARHRLREENGLGDEFTLDDMKVQHYSIAMDIVATAEDPKSRVLALKHAGAIYGVEAPKQLHAKVDSQAPRALPREDLFAKIKERMAARQRQKGTVDHDAN